MGVLRPRPRPRPRPPLLPLLQLLLLLPPTLSLSAPTLHPSLRSELCPVVLTQDPPSGPDILPPSLSNRRLSPTTPRIINGDLASTTLQTSLVSLLIPVPGGFATCTGTLISPRWVITAAHCEVDLSTVVSIAAPRRIDLIESPLFNLDQAFTHPAYDPTTMVNDVAVVRLAEPAPTSASVMRLNPNVAFPKPGAFVRAIGYGTSLNDQLSEPQRAAGFLRQVDVPVVTERTCIRVYGLQINYDAQVCAGYPRGGCDSCRGDSGGPLIQYDADNNPVLVGITSFGRQCAQPNAPGVYGRPGAHLDWMASVGAEFTPATNIVEQRADGAGPGADGSSGGNGPSIGLLAGIAAGAVALVVLVVAVVAVTVVKRRRRAAEGGDGGLAQPQPQAPGPVPGAEDMAGGLYPQPFVPPQGVPPPGVPPPGVPPAVNPTPLYPPVVYAPPPVAEAAQGSAGSQPAAAAAYPQPFVPPQGVPPQGVPPAVNPTPGYPPVVYAPPPVAEAAQGSAGSQPAAAAEDGRMAPEGGGEGFGGR